MSQIFSQTREKAQQATSWASGLGAWHGRVFGVSARGGFKDLGFGGFRSLRVQYSRVELSRFSIACRVEAFYGLVSKGPGYRLC